MQCQVCNASVSPAAASETLQCQLCTGVYHYVCLGIKKEQFVALNKNQLTSWTCSACVNITRRNNASNVLPSGAAAAAPSCIAAPSKPYSSQEEVTIDKISTLLDQKLHSSLSAFMEHLRNTLKEDIKKLVRAEVRLEIEVLKGEFTATTDFICDEQTRLRSEIDSKNNIIQNLESQNNELQKEVNLLHGRISSIEKMSRSCNVEIQAVPESRNENVLSLLKNLCEKLKVTLDDSSIHSCRRVAKMNTSSDRPRNILVTLSSPRLRDSLLSAAHRYNKANSNDTLSSRHLGIPGESRRIYLVEHLSPECKSIHAAARKTAKDKNYKYVWVKYGRVYVRKDDESGCIYIKNLDSLNKL